MGRRAHCGLWAPGSQPRVGIHVRTRTKGILVHDGERVVNKQHRGHRIFQRLGAVSQEEAETWLRQQQERIDAEAKHQLRARDAQLFRDGAGKYLKQLVGNGGVRSLDTISGHVLLLNEWVGDIPMLDLCNDSFATFNADRLAGRTVAGEPCRAAGPATLNRSLEVVRTVLNCAARVWRHNGKPCLPTATLVEMLDESGGRKPYPITWESQTKLVPALASHRQRPVLFALDTGARDENVCGLRWEWKNALRKVGLARLRVHDLRHTYGQRLRDAGAAEEDRALLMGHAIEGMPQHYAAATVARPLEAAN